MPSCEGVVGTLPNDILLLLDYQNETSDDLLPDQICDIRW